MGRVARSPPQMSVYGLRARGGGEEFLLGGTPPAARLFYLSHAVGRFTT